MKITYGLSLILTILVLSGCVTKNLHGAIEDHENGSTLYSNDIITAAAMTDLGKENYNWVFIGNNFDYALASGGRDFFHALATGKIDKTRLTVDKNGAFTLKKDKKQFSGSIELKYRYQDSAERIYIVETLKLPLWRCSDKQGDEGECTISLNDLKGTLHKKAQVPDDVFRFTHPIKVNFYTRNGLSAKRALYPVAVATDVALSPLYLLGTVAVLGVYGTILLHQ